MTTILGPTTRRDHVPGLPVRLSLTSKTTPAGRLDGAWWPYTRDLSAELPPLTAALDASRGRITRVTVSPARWPVIPREVVVDGRSVHVGRYTEREADDLLLEREADDLILLSCTDGRWDLSVIPPATRPAAADRLMAATAIPGSVLKADALMAGEAAAGRGMRRSRNQEDTWEAEGGACMSPYGYPTGPRVIPEPVPGEWQG
ncbi:DUF5994 family protein [Streptomyces cahuitamycinicus]|uniref:Uncharacterized protein n=1 Tax=Streptomyces cahuitamycinicus TaxID=2070367 RepID=A0A2N8TF31_9ACTN|nr:DUF5994 family protein [Streptomyces cahuitamycinicus]PNG17617.1 hypothetical protein C1J00_35585 [Streptomyces cahuitamycinicus]